MRKSLPVMKPPSGPMSNASTADAHLVASVRHDIGCRFRVGLVAVGEHDVLSDSDPARDGLTDLAGSDDDNDILHACTPVIS